MLHLTCITYLHYYCLDLSLVDGVRLKNKIEQKFIKNIKEYNKIYKQFDKIC